MRSRLLRERGTSVTATLVGNGPDEAALAAQVERLSLQDAIRFVSAMPARAALTLGHVMVIPSFAESLPYVVLETAAAGKPLITTNVGGIPEIYGPLSDALIPAGNVEALAEAIAQTSPTRPQRGACAGFARTRRRFFLAGRHGRWCIVGLSAGAGRHVGGAIGGCGAFRRAALYLIAAIIV